MIDAQNNTTDGEPAAEQADNFAEMHIQRIYVKDLSFESPSTPTIFREKWEPKAEFEMHTTSNQLDQQNHEVILRVVVTTRVAEKVAYIVEVQQAGIFSLTNFPEAQAKKMLGSYCPSVLFPYLRQSVAEAVMHGGFPQMNLAPVNFDVLYEQHAQGDDQVTADAPDLNLPQIDLGLDDDDDTDVAQKA